MKKNKMMRIASVLLVVTLLSTCVISGTFAKYVTKAEGGDKARVAKWGVLLSMEGDALFDTKYEVDDDSFLLDEDYSVISANSDNVVAPGTEGKNIKVTVSGAPEVAFRLIFGLKAEKEICLKKGTYTDYTELVHSTDGTYAYSETFTLADDYYPVKYTLKSGETTVAEGTIEEIVAGLQTFFGSVTGSATAVAVDEDGTVTGIEGAVYADFPANAAAFTEGVALELSWAWVFPAGELANVITDVDKADTFLGNVAAGKAASDNATTDMELAFTVIAVQID